MIQVIRKETPEKQTFGQKLGLGIGRGLETAGQLYKEHETKKAGQEEFQRQNETYNKLTGRSLSQDPAIRKMEIDYALKGEQEGGKFSSKIAENTKQIRAIEKHRQLPEGSLDAYVNDPKMAEQITRPPKETKPASGTSEVPPTVSKKIKKILADNPKASADELRSEMDEAGIPPTYSNPYTENRRRTEEHETQAREKKVETFRQETLPIRKQLADKAMAATHGIQNKQQLLDIIEKGNIDDPSYAALVEALPLKLGKRLLSNDTVEYKAGLVEEFGDLRNIFQGQTRIKEIELLEEKIADLYLTDDQKKSVLNSRINALKADQIRAEVAQEIENEPFGVLQFSQELEKRAKPKLEALFNKILDEQKSIIQDAENKKKIPLDLSDPEDKKIMQQIKKEANGDSKKALELAKQKGYIFR